jgi:hypothetical protein
VLKPTRVEPAMSTPVADIPRITPEPHRRPEPPRPAAPRAVPAPVQPEPARAPVDPPAPDAGILSDMARQLEQALKRPSAPVVDPSPPSTPVPAETPPAPAPAPPANPTISQFPVREDRRPVEPQAQTPRPGAEPKPTSSPAAAPTPAAAPVPLREVTDPFSVEEIEAEFARLLGRPGEKS